MISVYLRKYDDLILDHDILSDDEKLRRDGYVYEELAVHYVKRRSWLRRELSGVVGLAANELQFDYNKYGKPTLMGYPDILFNLSHSKNYVLLAIARSDPSSGRFEERSRIALGCDIEWMDPAVEIIEMAELVFSTVERSSLKQLSDKEARKNFFAIWSRKEAFIKAQGSGISYGLDRFTVGVEDDVKIDIKVPSEDSARDWTLYNLDLLPDYKVAICSAGEIGELVLR